VAECGFGVRLPSYEFENGQLHEAIDRLLTSPNERLSDASARLRGQPGTKRAADLIAALG
jgi:UDP:flavonoid glycosyltransferase YjiC (YdhE family)